jgi:pimeloyl-ACP methyl ester carboxylesterase
MDGIEVHFVRVRPKVTNAKILPLLLVHGWPGSFLEFKDIIPLLTEVQSENKEYVFDLIMPSIPGYGFSSAPRKPGFHSGHCARIFRDLMIERLGFKDGFYMQGGDWGGIITTALATLYPDDVIGLHLNFAVGSTPSVPLKQMISAVAPTFLSKSLGLQYEPSVKRQFAQLIEETGYFHLQATKPDTLGVSLNTSPLGLAAYILEKFSTWTRYNNKKYSDGKILEYYNIDDLLNNVMLYWVTNSITTSMRFYKENFGNNKKSMKEMLGVLRNPINDVPVGIASYSDDIFLFGKAELQGKYRNIVQYHYMPDGGHFAAMEDANRLYQDYYNFILIVENNKEKRKKTVSNEL